LPKNWTGYQHPEVVGVFAPVLLMVKVPQLSLAWDVPVIGTALKVKELAVDAVIDTL
jgi:hypothetical protein